MNKKYLQPRSPVGAGVRCRMCQDAGRNGNGHYVHISDRSQLFRGARDAPPKVRAATAPAAPVEETLEANPAPSPTSP